MKKKIKNLIYGGLIAAGLSGAGFTVSQMNQNPYEPSDFYEKLETTFKDRIQMSKEARSFYASLTGMFLSTIPCSAGLIGLIINNLKKKKPKSNQ